MGSGLPDGMALNFTHFDLNRNSKSGWHRASNYEYLITILRLRLQIYSCLGIPLPIFILWGAYLRSASVAYPHLYLFFIFDGHEGNCSPLGFHTSPFPWNSYAQMSLHRRNSYAESLKQMRVPPAHACPMRWWLPWMSLQTHRRRHLLPQNVLLMTKHRFTFSIIFLIISLNTIQTWA